MGGYKISPTLIQNNKNLKNKEFLIMMSLKKLMGY